MQPLWTRRIEYGAFYTAKFKENGYRQLNARYVSERDVFSRSDTNELFEIPSYFYIVVYFYIFLYIYSSIGILLIMLI